MATYGPALRAVGMTMRPRWSQSSRVRWLIRWRHHAIDTAFWATHGISEWLRFCCKWVVRDASLAVQQTTAVGPKVVRAEVFPGMLCEPQTPSGVSARCCSSSRSSGSEALGLGFRVQGFRQFRVWGLGWFRGLYLEVHGCSFPKFEKALHCSSCSSSRSSAPKDPSKPMFCVLRLQNHRKMP